MIFLKAFLLAVVEGVTEFLPVSSTGHMILVDEFVRLSEDQAFVDAFMVIIQLPAILAVVVYFWRQLWPFVRDRAECVARIGLWIRICAAFLPAAVLGFFLDDFIEEKLFNSITVALALLVGGVILIVLERRPRPGGIPTARDIGFPTAVAIGLFQGLAMIPGTSRSAATIVGAMTLGASRLASAEFSFFLAIPTMFGATAYKMLKNGLDFTGEQWAVLALGSVVSFLVALVVVAVFMNYVRKRSLVPFGYYRIVLAIVVFAFYLIF